MLWDGETGGGNKPSCRGVSAEEVETIMGSAMRKVFTCGGALRSISGTEKSSHLGKVGSPKLSHLGKVGSYIFSNGKGGYTIEMENEMENNNDNAN